MVVQMKYEIRGLQVELVGLFFLLIATFWQSEFSGWWDKQLPESQNFIQEQVNLEVLHSLSVISKLAAISDAELRKKLAYETSKRAEKKIISVIDMREDRRKALNGQAALFSTIRLALALAGAVLLILGKYLSLKAAYSRNKQ